MAVCGAIQLWLVAITAKRAPGPASFFRYLFLRNLTFPDGTVPSYPLGWRMSEWMEAAQHLGLPRRVGRFAHLGSWGVVLVCLAFLYYQGLQ